MDAPGEPTAYTRGSRAWPFDLLKERKVVVVVVVVEALQARPTERRARISDLTECNAACVSPFLEESRRARATFLLRSGDGKARNVC